MYKASEVKGQIYSNRIRANLSRIMEQRGMSGKKALPHMGHAGLWKFVSGRGDITVTRLQHIADDLGIGFFDLLKHPDKKQP